MPAKKTPPPAVKQVQASKAAKPTVAAKEKPGQRKPLAKKAAAGKPTVEIELHVDDELEFDISPEVAADPGAKAKPLRMKVPKSKERALIREFGLDMTTLTEEEVEKRRRELTTLVKMGRRGAS
jgi:RNA polymerase primary sigma factor